MKCTTEGCDKPVKVKKRGLCSTHYQYWARKNKPRGMKVCGVDECTGPVYAKGWCHNHYEKAKRHDGDPTWTFEVTYCECGERAVAKGRCKRHYSIWWYYESMGKGFNPDHHNFKDEINYITAHSRVRRIKGNPKDYECVECGGTANEWALSAFAENLLFGPSSYDRDTLAAFSMNVDDYLPMCRSCHRAYDARFKNRNYKLQPSRWEELR